MTREEFKPLAKKMKLAYQKDRFLPDNETMNLWFEMLEDLDAALVGDAITNHIKTNPYPPAIADIRKLCEEAEKENSRYRAEMREIFSLTIGGYPGFDKYSTEAVKWWNEITADSHWSMRIEKAKAVSTEIASYVRDMEINGEVNNIPTFTELLKSIAKGTKL